MLRVLKLRCSHSYASNLSRLFMAQYWETFRYYCTVKSRTSLTKGAKQNIKGIAGASHLKMEKSVLKSETFKENATGEVNKKIKSTEKHHDSKKSNNTLTSTDARPLTNNLSTYMKKEPKNLQQYKMNRDLVPDYIMLRLRNDVMGGPEYSGRFSAGRKPWVELSETSVSLLQQLKLAKDLSAMQQILDKISNEKLIKFLEELVSDTSFLKQSSQGSSGQGSYLTDGSSQRLRKSTSLIDALITECQTRMHSADGASVLLFVDIIKHLTMNIHNGEYLWKKVASLALKIFEDRWEELSSDKRDVLGVCYVIGTFRNSPVYLLHFIETYIHTHASQLNLAEIALICHAFFAANTSISMFRNLQCIDGVVTRELDSLILCNRAEIEKNSKTSLKNLLEGQNDVRDTLRGGTGSVKFYHLSCILKALKHSQYDRVIFYERLGDNLGALSNSLGSASLADLSTLMLTYASLSIIHPKLLQTISSRACGDAYIGPHASPRMKDLGRIIWSLAELRQDVPTALSNKLINVMRGSRETMLKYPESCVESLVGLAMIEIYPKDLLEMVLSKRFGDVKKSRPLEQDFQMRLLETLVQMNDINTLVISEDVQQVEFEKDPNRSKVIADTVKVNHLDKSGSFEHISESASSTEVVSNRAINLKDRRNASAISTVDESLKTLNINSKKKLHLTGIISDIYDNKKLNNIKASGADGTNSDKELGITAAASNSQGIVYRILSGAESKSAELNRHPISSSDDDVTDVEDKSSRSLGDIVHELKTRQGLASFVTTLEEILGTNGKVHVGFILPFSRITDVMIRVDLLTRKPLIIESSHLPWEMSLKAWNTKYVDRRKSCLNSESNNLTNKLRDRNEGVLSNCSNYEELMQDCSVITGQVNNSSVKIKNALHSRIKKLESVERDLHNVIPKIKREESVKNLSSLASVETASDLNQIYRSCESVLESVLRERNGSSHSKNNFNPVSKAVDNFCDRSKRSSGFILIKVLGENQYSRNTAQMLGLPALELGLLSRLNYEVSIIEPDVAKKLDAMSQQDRKIVVRKFLKDKCNVHID